MRMSITGSGIRILDSQLAGEAEKMWPSWRKAVAGGRFGYHIEFTLFPAYGSKCKLLVVSPTMPHLASMLMAYHMCAGIQTLVL